MDRRILRRHGRVRQGPQGPGARGPSLRRRTAHHDSALPRHDIPRHRQGLRAAAPASDRLRRTPRQLPARGRDGPGDDARRRDIVPVVRHPGDVRRNRRARRVPVLLLQVRHRHGRVPDHDLHGRRRDDRLRTADRESEDGASRRRGPVRHLLRALRRARPRGALRRWRRTATWRLCRSSSPRS